MSAITKKIIDDVQYFETVRRGVAYTLYRFGDDWCLLTRREALGRFNVGGCKYFTTLQEVAANCKAFGDAASLLGLVFGVFSVDENLKS